MPTIRTAQLRDEFLQQHAEAHEGKSTTPHSEHRDDDRSDLFYPVTDANFDTDSYNTFADGPWLTKKATQWF